MPKSRSVRNPKLGRAKKRLSTAQHRLAYLEALTEMIDDALKGIGMEAIYVPDPVPHVVIQRIDVSTIV